MLKLLIVVCNLSGKSVSILKFLKGLQGSFQELQTINSDFCKAELLDMVIRKGWVNRKINIAHYIRVSVTSGEGSRISPVPPSEPMVCEELR